MAEDELLVRSEEIGGGRGRGRGREGGGKGELVVVGGGGEAAGEQGRPGETEVGQAGRAVGLNVFAAPGRDRAAVTGAGISTGRRGI